MPRALPLIGLVLVATACRDISSVAAPGDAARAVTQSPLGAQPDRYTHGPFRTATLDEEFEALADTIPGFAGLVGLPGQAKFRVLLKDRSQEAAARPVVTRFLRAKGAAEDFDFTSARFDFRVLMQWRRDIKRSAPGLLTGIGVDEANNVVEVAVKDETARTALLRVLEARGIPTEAVVIELSPGATREDLSSYRRPVIGGLLIQATGSNGCTLGFVAIQDVAGVFNTSGPRYVVTNAHCAPPMGQMNSTTIGQPDLSNPIGTEISDPSYFYNSTDSRCDVGNKCRLTDAAMFQLTSNSTAVSAFNTVAYWQNPVMVTPTYTGRQQGFAMGQTVTKVGITTNRTSGVIVRTCYDALVPLSTGDEEMLCQYGAKYGSDGGDSGSPVYFVNDSGWWVVGIHWGKDYQDNTIKYFSMWMHVADELGNDIYARTGQLWRPAFTTGPINYQTF